MSFKAGAPDAHAIDNRKRRASTTCLAALTLLATAAVAGATASHRDAGTPTWRPVVRQQQAQAHASQIRRPRWVNGVEVTEYYPIPESFFNGAKVRAPGLTGAHRIDWLYSARGLTMEGDGIGLDGHKYHVENVGSGGWVDKLGRPSSIGTGSIFWRAGGFYRNARRQLTYPLDGGGWSHGAGRRYVGLRGVSFGNGPSLPLTYYHSLAVDPSVIALGSRVYIPAYRRHGGGWFIAQDTGGAIGGRHVDVFRSPPTSPNDYGQLLRGQRIYVIPPGKHAPGNPTQPSSPSAPTSSGGGSQTVGTSGGTGGG
jgi:3D (Asp-Asp-Asp) domain-containing protein